MKEFLNRFQKDLNTLQQTIEKEGEVLVKRIRAAAKKAAANKNVQAKRKEVEKLVETNLKKFEPAVTAFMKNVKTNANKYGIDLSAVEKRVEKSVRAATKRLKTKSTGKAKTAKRASAAKKSPSKASTKSKAAAASSTDAVATTPGTTTVQ